MTPQDTLAVLGAMLEGGHPLNGSEVGDPSGKAGLDAFAFLAFSNPV